MSLFDDMHNGGLLLFCDIGGIGWLTVVYGIAVTMGLR